MNDKARAAQVAIWTAIDEYARSCGGDPGRLVYGNTRRQTAVVDVERAVVAIQDAHAEELQLTPPRPLHKHECRDAEVDALRAENARLQAIVAAATAFQFWGGSVLCPRLAKVYPFESPSGATWWAIDLLLGVDGSRIEARDDRDTAIAFAKARAAGEPE